MSRWANLSRVNQIYGSIERRNTLFAKEERERREAEAMQTAAVVAEQLRAEAANAGEVIPPPAKDFYLAGRAIFTIEIPAAFAEQHKTKRQYTFKIAKSMPTEKFPNPALFVYLLTGSDNQNDYSYVGILNSASGRVSSTNKSIIPQDSMPVKLLNRVLLNIWTGTPELITAAGFDVHHEGRCAKCGRPLTDSESVKIGMGPTCRANV